MRGKQKEERKQGVRVRALGDRNCRTEKEKWRSEADEKECEERNVGGFQRRTRRTVASPRIETIGVFPREDSIGLTFI